MSPQYRRGDLHTINGTNEDNHACRVVLQSPENAIGHVWLPDGTCVAFEIRKGGPAFVGVDPVGDRAWGEVRRKAKAFDQREAT